MCAGSFQAASAALGRHVHVEGRAHLVHQAHQLGAVGHAVAHAQTGQAPGLGEGAQHDPGPDPRIQHGQHIGVVIVMQRVFVIGLVHHQHGVGGRGLQHLRKLRRIHHAAHGVGRVGQEGDLGGLGHGAPGAEIEAQLGVSSRSSRRAHHLG
jgi:hypothetical protein